MSFSSVGRTKIAANLFLLLLNIIVLALSTRVNLYQDFFFVADRFPFILSIITFVVLGLMTLVDFCSNNSYTGRAQFEIGVFSILSIFWMAFNAFSSSRWSSVPLSCGGIPSEYPDVLQWCHELTALRVLVWFEWLTFFFTLVLTLRYAITESNRGNKHIFKMPLSRYDPSLRSDAANNNLAVDYGYGHNDFSAYGKLN
uniref:MARVEL domain-containing protein n=1 Tax=Mycena chlorophos TaxID=658473 RepID=A0ABQ0M9S9_MYCCL|nr:predicted protein [Mycena chlorophos]